VSGEWGREELEWPFIFSMVANLLSLAQEDWQPFKSGIVEIRKLPRLGGGT
jgi:hypothetical protein